MYLGEINASLQQRLRLDGRWDSALIVDQDMCGVWEFGMVGAEVKEGKLGYSGVPVQGRKKDSAVGIEG
jgi:hypothetical protein